MIMAYFLGHPVFDRHCMPFDNSSKLPNNVNDIIGCFYTQRSDIRLLRMK